MDNLKKVEKLMERADVSYEEAKAVLEECDWDVLEAVVKLESQGKLKKNASTASYSTDGSAGGQDSKSPQEMAKSYEDYTKSHENKERSAFHTLWKALKLVLKKSCENTFIVKKDSKIIMEMPVLLMAILMICFFWILLILMVISLFCGFSYGFSGPELGRDNVNNAMGRASEMAENIKADIISEAHNHERAASEKGSGNTQAADDGAHADANKTGSGSEDAPSTDDKDMKR